MEGVPSTPVPKRLAVASATPGTVKKAFAAVPVPRVTPIFSNDLATPSPVAPTRRSLREKRPLDVTPAKASPSSVERRITGQKESCKKSLDFFTPPRSAKRKKQEAPDLKPVTDDALRELKSAGAVVVLETVGPSGERSGTLLGSTWTVRDWKRRLHYLERRKQGGKGKVRPSEADSDRDTAWNGISLAVVEDKIDEDDVLDLYPQDDVPRSGFRHLDDDRCIAELDVHETYYVVEQKPSASMQITFS
mmetsp:Transcript_17291/g.65896  ORF Transcript_17291/g.65896 Transcript_17291/m.65896 type:complete len:248 (-) Transcript_17291:59-802(-)